MNTPWSERPWRQALVYGLGLSGLAAARLLRSNEVSVLGVDRRSIEEIDLGDLASDDGVRLLLGSDPQVLPGAFDGVVVSPGVSQDRPLIRDAKRLGVPVISEVELAFPYLNGSVIGITGSNGKSTTTAMAGAALRAAGREVEVCGNIGVPLSSRVAGAAGRTFVVEVSSFQLESIDTFRPHAAALLNLSEDHLDRHRDLDSYRSAKERIFARQEDGDVAVLNADDPLIAELALRARTRFFSRSGPVEDGCFLTGDRVLEAVPGSAPRELFRVEDLRVPGVHNLENAMAAALLARALGAEREAVRSGVGEFTGLPHRVEHVARLGDVEWVDDSKGTNVAATVKSLQGFSEGSVHLILGGRHKGGDWGELVDLVREKARRVYLIGEAEGELSEVLAGFPAIESCGDLETAVERAAGLAVEGEVVLLSPACASFDQYDSYARRGEHFQTLVRSLEEASDG